jgi:hypothetical protein
MELNETIAVLRRHGLSVREIEKVTGVPKSTIHHLIKQSGIHVIRNDAVTVDGHKFYMIHFPYTFYCPGCGLEQNHAWICVECGVLIPAECEPNKACAQGFNISEFVWGQRLST